MSPLTGTVNVWRRLRPARSVRRRRDGRDSRAGAVAVPFGRGVVDRHRLAAGGRERDRERGGDRARVALRSPSRR